MYLQDSAHAMRVFETLGTIFSVKFQSNTITFMPEYSFENIIWKISPSLLKPWDVKHPYYFYTP